MSATTYISVCTREGDIKYKFSYFVEVYMRIGHRHTCLFLSIFFSRVFSEQFAPPIWRTADDKLHALLFTSFRDSGRRLRRCNCTQSTKDRNTQTKKKKQNKNGKCSLNKTRLCNVQFLLRNKSLKM